ncbi:MAG: hypothetical protein ABI345_06335 [Jatrophihabitans sp.]
MIDDPFTRVPSATRLWAAAALCIVPFGLVWSQRASYVVGPYVGPSFCNEYGYCTPGAYSPGVYLPGSTTLVSQSPARVFLVAAAALLVFVATRTRTAATRRLARLATGALAVAVLLAASQRATLTMVCVLSALALVVPLVWIRPVGRGVLATGDVRG